MLTTQSHAYSVKGPSFVNYIPPRSLSPPSYLDERTNEAAERRHNPRGKTGQQCDEPRASGARYI